jgi:hypothetical protein
VFGCLVAVSLTSRCGRYLQRTKRIEGELLEQEAAQRADVGAKKQEAVETQQKVLSFVSLLLSFSPTIHAHTGGCALRAFCGRIIGAVVDGGVQLLTLTQDNTSLLRVIGELTAQQLRLERELNTQVCGSCVCPCLCLCLCLCRCCRYHRRCLCLCVSVCIAACARVCL